MSVSPPLWTMVRTTLNAVSPGYATRVDVPAGARWVLTRFMGATGQFGYTGTDGASIGSAYLSVTGDQLVRMPVAGRGALFLASPSLGTVVEIVFVDADDLAGGSAGPAGAAGPSGSPYGMGDVPVAAAWSSWHAVEQDRGSRGLTYERISDVAGSYRTIASTTSFAARILGALGPHGIGVYDTVDIAWWLAYDYTAGAWIVYTGASSLASAQDGASVVAPWSPWIRVRANTASATIAWDVSPDGSSWSEVTTRTMANNALLWGVMCQGAGSIVNFGQQIIS